MKQTDSEITTTLGEMSWQIGTPPGEHGSEMRESSPVQKWLEARNPKEVEAALQSQASSLNVALKAEYRSIYRKNEIGESVHDRYILTRFVANGTRNQVQEMVKKVEAAMKPPEVGMIEEWLAELSVITAKRADDQMSEALRLEAYTRRLREYPTDVVRHALLGNRWKFWPTWAELADFCDEAVQVRRAMLEALRAALNQEEKPSPPPPLEPTEAERFEMAARAQAIVEQAGFTTRRSELLARCPDARTIEDAEQMDAAPRLHWTETVDPDGPEMAALREARRRNPLVRAALGLPQMEEKE